MSSLYIHIPFCRSKCLYCSFTSYPGKERFHCEYIDAVKREIGLLSQLYSDRAYKLRTIFIGGGTPTSISADLLCGLLGYIPTQFKVEEDAEISVEANPGTVDSIYLKRLREAGANRLSFGVQSFIDTELDVIGRTHLGKEAEAAVRMAQHAGFCNINIDLMYGLPGQTEKTWQDSLTTALNLDIEHLSLYQLTIEEETPFAAFIEAGSLALPSETEVLKMEKITRTLCHRSGFAQYEISNFCRETYSCAHNINYWQNNDYLAAGAAAVSFINGVREKRVSEVETYISLSDTHQSVIADREQLGVEESFRETVIMGLRMTCGVSRKRLWQRFGIELEIHYGKILKDLVDQGFVDLSQTHLKISAKGWPLSNQIMARLV